MTNKTVRKVTMTSKGAIVKFTTNEETNGQIKNGKHTDDYDHPVHPDFTASMKSLKSYFMQFFEFHQSATDNIKITGISIGGRIGEKPDDDNRTVTIRASVTSLNDSKTNIETGRIILASDVYGWERKLLELTDAISNEAIEYVKGKSAQMTIDQQIEEQNEGFPVKVEESAPEKTKAVKKQSGKVKKISASAVA